MCPNYSEAKGDFAIMYNVAILKLLIYQMAQASLNEKDSRFN